MNDQPRQTQTEGAAALSTRQRTRAARDVRRSPSLKPSAFSTPSSLVRSRTACAIVVPVTRRIVKNTMLTMAMNDGADVADLARPGLKEGLRRRSLRFVRTNWQIGCRDRAATSRAAAGCVTRMMYQPTVSRVLARRLVQVLVVEEHLRAIRTGTLRVIDAENGEGPRSTVRCGPRRALQRDSDRRRANRYLVATSRPTMHPERSASHARRASGATR